MVTLALVVGCATRSVPRQDGRDLVRLQLNWLPDAQFGGYYAALLAGEYKRAGLDVEIRIGGPDASVLPKLAMNRVEFGLGNADQLLLARQEGADVVAVFAVMQDNPRCIMVHASSGIDSFDELRNVTLAMGEGNAFAKFLKTQLPLTGVRIVSYAGNVAKFVVDDQFAQQGYVFSEPIVAKQRGSDPSSLMVSQLGFNPYAGIVMTSRSLAKQNPDLVRRFVEATRRGWLRYLAAPDAANQEIHRLNQEVDLDSLQTAVDVLRPLCLTVDETAASGSKPDSPSDTTTFGSMTAKRWQTLHDQLTSLALLKPGSESFDPAHVFTNKFNRPTKTGPPTAP
jgi:NitT/TauT family transport system substrate-binding protein